LCVGCCVECVGQIHRESVAAPIQAVLDVGIREPGAIEEVCGCDANGVAGPDKEVLVVVRYFEDLVCCMPEEGGRQLPGRL